MPTEDEVAVLVAQAELERAVEYGTYVANQPIDIGGVRAFNVGHPVPVSHVTRGVVEASQVDKVSNPPKFTKAAVEAAAEKKGV